MSKNNRTGHLIISMILTISLITSSFFVITPDNALAEESSEATEQIEDLTEPANPEAEYDGYIVKVKDNKTAKVDEDEAAEYEATPDNKFIMVDEPEDSLDFIDPDYIDFIEPNYKRLAYGSSELVPESTVQEKGVQVTESNVQPFDYPSTLRNQSEYTLIGANSAWSSGFTGTGADVAVFDTGIYKSHEAFSATIFGNSYNFLNIFYYGIREGLNPTPNYNITDGYGYGHGTPVTGLIAANGRQDVQGIAYNSSVSMCRIMGNNGEGSVGDFIQGLYTYLELSIKNTGSAPDVLNMSFGAPGYSYAEYYMLSYYTERSTILVAASGNSGNAGSPYEYPANYENVIAVGSVDINRSPSYFSTANSSVVVSAPGNGIVSVPTVPGKYLICEGTSFSSPIVAGAAALVRQNGYNVTQSQFLTLLKTTSNDTYTKGYDIYTGWGILDINKLTKAAKAAKDSGKPIANSYKIAYETGGGKISGSPPTIHTQGATTVLPKSVSKTGYNFSHWVDEGGKKITSISSSYKNGDLTLKAVYSAKSYKLTFKGNGGKVTSKTKTVKYQSAVGTLKTPKKRKGYNFLGWFTKKKGGTQYYKGKIYKKAGSITLYAHWTKKKTVKFNANGGTVSKYAKAIKKGKKYGSLPTPSRSGYAFKGWYTKKKGGKKITKSSKVAKNKNYTIYAHWKKKSGK